MKKFTSFIICMMLLLSFASLGHSAETRRSPSKKKTAVKIGAGAGVGAVVGGLIGGGRGAAAGALIGGGGMAAHSMAKRDSGYGRKTRKVSTIAAGTAVGAGVGAAIGGGKGAGIGALVGGGASTLYAFTRKDLKKPKPQERYYESRQGGQNNGAYANNYPNNSYPNNNYPSNYTTARAIDMNDPYQRMATPQGAGVGRLLSSGSSSIYY